MLAYYRGSLLNTANLARSLSVSAPTVSKYVDFLVKLMLVRRLRPYTTNLKKRIVKASKVYIRDTGVTHVLLGLENHFSLLGHPVVGASWEGFVIENLIDVAPHGTIASFYRTSAGAEVGLVLELPGNFGIWAIEIKRSVRPKLSKSFRSACADPKPAKSFYVYSGTERFFISQDVEAIGLSEMMSLLRAAK